VTKPIQAIDAVVNIWTEEAMSHRPASFQQFFVDKMGVDGITYKGISLDEMLRRPAPGPRRAAFARREA